MDIPSHKRYVYSHEGVSALNVGVVQESQIWDEIRIALSADEINALINLPVEDIYEKIFRYATKFEGWIDDEWRTE